MKHSRAGYILKDKDTGKHYIAYHRDQLEKLRAQGKALVLPVDERFEPLKTAEQKLVLKSADRLTVIGMCD